MSLDFAACECISKEVVKIYVQRLIAKMKKLFSYEIENLEKIIRQKQQKIIILEDIVQQYNKRIQEITSKLNIKQQEYKINLQKNQIRINSLQNKYQQLQQDLNNSEKSKKDILSRLHQKEKQYDMLLKQADYDKLSMSLSLISNNQSKKNQSYTTNIEEYFSSYPATTLKLLQSLEGCEPQEKNERGNMICLFIGKDELSAQKYININRTFLKRAIKAQQKRFKIVIIYRP